ncbi:hypothetical protein ZWY2020_036253 [Hordeum vulgare]|nr:hypothetical protein ZWY2020_036253 [Hordeum vulgare]
MKIAKAPLLLKKAAAMCIGKTGIVMARFLVFASPSRRMATICAISHRIHALVLSNQEKGSKVDYHKTLVHKVEKQACHEMFDDLSHHLAPFDQEDDVGDCTNWTLHPIFSDGDNCSYTDEYDDYDHDEDEHSVVDAMRSNQEAEELAFDMDDDIDQATKMFIRRFCEQMSKSFL